MFIKCSELSYMIQGIGAEYSTIAYRLPSLDVNLYCSRRGYGMFVIQ